MTATTDGERMVRLETRLDGLVTGLNGHMANDDVVQREIRDSIRAMHESLNKRLDAQDDKLISIEKQAIYTNGKVKYSTKLGMAAISFTCTLLGFLIYHIAQPR